jgi:hypothetical protein
MRTIQWFFVWLLLAVSAIAQGQFTFNVTSPSSGTPSDPTFLGSNNTVRFNVNNAVREMTVTVTAINTNTNSQVVREDRFTPNSDNKIDGSIVLNFNQATTEGNYIIEVRARYSNDPPASATLVTLTDLILDVTKPKIIDFNPTNNSFVGGGNRIIRATIRETNLKEYRVQINGQDIPNNTGTSLVNDELQVTWDTTGIISDGPQTVSINVKDKANNETTQTFTVTLDRVAPTVTISAPRTDAPPSRNSDFNVVVDTNDFGGGSVDVTGIDVIIRSTSGAFIYRVPRVSFSQGPSSRWIGRVRGLAVQLPNTFRIDVTVTDRAGNQAVTQRATVTLR